jgi:formate dehydrogenase
MSKHVPSPASFDCRSGRCQAQTPSSKVVGRSVRAGGGPALLGDDPRRADLLIEYLHRIQDSYGHISAAHVVALAAEMKLAMTEVYEVATFYHHFDVIKEGDAVPPAITVRVCDSLSCELAGANDLLSRLPAVLGPGVRVIPAPCVGRCHGRRLGRRPESTGSRHRGGGCRRQKAVKAPSGISISRITAPGRLSTHQDCLGGKRDLNRC